jgi:hypothetical protein
MSKSIKALALAFILLLHGSVIAQSSTYTNTEIQQIIERADFTHNEAWKAKDDFDMAFLKCDIELANGLKPAAYSVNHIANVLVDNRVIGISDKVMFEIAMACTDAKLAVLSDLSRARSEIPDNLHKKIDSKVYLAQFDKKFVECVAARLDMNPTLVGYTFATTGIQSVHKVATLSTVISRSRDNCVGEKVVQGAAGLMCVQSTVKAFVSCGALGLTKNPAMISPCVDNFTTAGISCVGYVGAAIQTTKCEAEAAEHERQEKEAESEKSNSSNSSNAHDGNGGNSRSNGGGTTTNKSTSDIGGRHGAPGSKNIG